MKRFTIRFQNGSWCYVTPNAEGWAAVPLGCPALAEPWYTYCVWNNGGESIRPKQGYTWEYLDAVASGQPHRDYSEWVEGMGDSAKPPDYDADPRKYECEFRHVFQGDWRPFTTSAWPVFLPVRVRLRRQEPTTQPEQPAPEPLTPTPDPEPPVLKSLVIRPDGCVVLIGGTSVKIPHSAALDLAGELCRSRRQ